MPVPQKPVNVAYLAPELPALSATFVYEELLALERRGVRVTPFSVHRPAQPARGLQDLAIRTEVLYDASLRRVAIDAVAALAGFGSGSARALGWLVSDMIEVGPWRLAAWKLAYQWLAGARLGRRLRQGGCTHLHVHFAHVPTQIAMYASAFSGVPFTLVAHANDIFERGLLLPQKARRAVKMLTISQHNAAYLVSVGVPPDRLEVVRCGVSLSPRADKPSFEQRSVYRIGTLGRLVEKKGIDDLIRAMHLLRDAPSQIELEVVGDGPLRPALEALTDELQMRHRVRFNGSLAHGEVAGWLRTLDVFALACKADAHGDMDGIPVVLMEAMSQRVPVVSTHLSGIPELVIHECTGLLSPPADPAALASALQRLCESPSLRARLTDAAAEHVREEFGQERNLDRLLRHILPTSRDMTAAVTATPTNPK